MGYTATRPAWNASSPWPEFTPSPDQWVKLRDLPSTYSADTALLICEEENDTWVAWVPNHGELRLRRQQFYRLEDSD